MKTVAICSRKGGAGKTTLSVSLAVAAFQARRQAAIINLDPQGSAKTWYNLRQQFQKLDAPAVINGQVSHLHRDLKSAKEHGAELVFLDTAPNAETAVEVAADVADFILIPCRPALVDLDAIRHTIGLVRGKRKPAAVVFNAMPPRGLFFRTEAEEAVRHHQFLICPRKITHRSVFMRCLNAGMGPQEYEPRGKAAKEIQALYKWLMKQLGM